MNQARKNGFTLVEMAIVLMIVGLLLGSMLVPLSAQMEQQLTNETRKHIDEVQQALIGFAVATGRLPCPAQATLATGQADAGVEATKGSTCACKSTTGNDKTIADSSASKEGCTDTSVTGVLPWVTLGIKETDAWGRRYTYRVTTRFADQISAETTDCNPALADSPTLSSFALCSPGVLDVESAATSGVDVAPDVPAVFLSHGKNGAGAYLPSGTKLAVSNLDEAENSDNDNTFVSHDLTTGFDDLPLWISHNILFNRMVAAGRLP